LRIRIRLNPSAVRHVLLLSIGAAIHGQDQPNPLRMQAMNRDLGVTCSYCHVSGGWTRDDNPQFAFTIRMSKMQDGLNAGTLRDFGGITCWTCHRGNAKPARMPRSGWEDRLANWPAKLKLADADAKRPAEEVYRNIQSLKGSAAGGLAMTMSVFAAALDVSCEYCHVADHWDSDAKAPKKTARRMLSLFPEVATYFETSRQPRMQCYTCHQGSPKPQRVPAA
jgi:hypothetical protein